MATNEYGAQLNRNGYAPSIIQTDLTRCYRCRRTDDKLDRHELFGAANRAKSKRYGLWCRLCHSSCHEGPYGVHMNPNEARYMHQLGQKAAMQHYGWAVDEFREKFGKNYL